ncbi:MAG: cupin domain-containing protein [Fimbriimonadales bacterium]|nr:cupin domain-containing protein [Fimbriimonadales bacterium]
MIYRFQNGEWPDVAQTRYKDEPGTWVGVSRRVFTDNLACGFEARCFEIEPGGFTSFERHRHSHLVLVLAGRGRVRLGDAWHPIGPMDVVRVDPLQPHRFSNDGSVALRILCVVDRERDRPELLDPDEAAGTSKG